MFIGNYFETLFKGKNKVDNTMIRRTTAETVVLNSLVFREIVLSPLSS